ncbi:Peptidase S10, serine carboxypeptidase [Candidatus Sulfopaludibacter sp. SbA3]|nr:Peptidase S10, serine carboxypeptidase [Candidatus Sulfopaludibacter sp. SbA3]
MRHLRHGRILLVITLGISSNAWGQGGTGRAGRAAAAQQAGAPATAPATPPGRGAAAVGAGGGASDFYTYDPAAGSGPAIPDSQPTEAHQKITSNGEALAYTTRVGFMPLRNATTGQSEAHLFYTSYTRDGVSEGTVRPVLFFLGGAPGVAAAWQEFGGVGPKRMKWTNDGTAGMPPYTWVDNPNTLLGQADLVFVNPVGTAYSRPDQPSRGPSFWNTAADVASLGEFVRSFIHTSNRRNSPLFLAGEDFGTARVAGLAAYLIEHQIPVHGVVLLSMAPSGDAVAGDAQYITLLPSLIMTAWHHKKLAPDLNAMSAEQISGQARQFASREYLHALYKGDRMTPEERTKVVANLSRLTGLTKAFILNNDLRISLDRFSSELMRDQHRSLANSDARVTGFIPSAGGGRGGRGGFGAPAAAIDFNESNLAGGFQTAYESYLQRELTYNGSSSGIFYLSSGGVGVFTSTGSDDASLAAAFARNPKLRLFVGINYFDLNAPFYAAEFTLAHLNVSPEVRARNITVSHFEAGQRTYVDNKALAKLQSELSRFVKGALQ